MTKNLLTLTAVAFSGILIQGVAGSLPPKDKLDWSLKDAFKIQTETREKISLNGVWKISLQTGAGLFPQKKLTKKEKILENLKGKKKEIIPGKTFENEKNWKQIRVPGLWYDAAWWSSTQYESMLDRKEFKTPLIRVCNKVKWLGKPLKDFYFAWYEREFKIPENWKQGKIFLKFDKFNRQGWVFVNSHLVGSQDANQSREMLLPSNLKAGDRVRLDILISAFVSGNDTLFMGGEQIHKIKKQSFFRGISGNAWLLRRPGQNYIEDIFIETSVREKKLKLKVKFSTPPEGILTGTIKNWKDGKDVKSFSSPLKDCRKLTANEYELELPWNKPILWTPDNPHLYTLNLAWKTQGGKIIDEDYPRRFGFREIWIKGREYYLNGHPVRFRIATGQAMPKVKAAAFFKELKEIGENCIEILSGKPEESCDVSEILDAADENGVLVFYMMPGINKLTHTWRDENVRKKWKKKLKASFNTVKNHPSIVQWGMNFNLLGYPFDLEPHKLGMDYYPSETSASGTNWKTAKESQEILKKMDPSRPTYHHAGGNYGEAHTSNMYLCFCPLQEKSEWPMIWAKKGVKPFMPIELGTPCELSYYHNREGVGNKNNFKSEPLYAEYAARMLGPDAYFMAAPERMKKILNFPVKANALGDNSDLYKGMMGYYYTALRAKSLDDFINTQCKLGEFIKDWRAFGVSGFNPWYNKYALRDNLKPYNNKAAEYESLKSPGYKTLFEYKPSFSRKTALYRKYQEWLKPELLYICGAKNEFTDKSCAFYSGTKIEKAFVWINDTFGEIKAKMRVELVKADDDKKAFEKTFAMKAKAGQIQFQGFSFAAPNVKHKTSYLIRLYENGKLRDEREIRIFPEMPAAKLPLKRKILLIDSKGYTSVLLKKLNVEFSKFDGQTFSSSDLLIIGRESLCDALPLAKAIGKAVKGGMNLIVFEQKSGELEEAFGLRCFNASARRVFAGKNNAFGIFKNLDNKDLADWPGKATLLEEYPKPDKDKYPQNIWKFGNRQVVSSAVIEKPHKGPYRSLLHEGFDLAYTPLLEETCGKGRIMFCQLDLAGRTKPNPAGDIILKRLLKRMDESAKEKRNVYYVGGPEGKRIMDSTGVEYHEVNNIKELPENSVIVIGGSKNYTQKQLTILKNLGKEPKSIVLDKYEKELNEFIKNGGTVVILAANDLDKTARTFSTNMPRAQMTDYKFKQKAIKGITEGLGGGDWYWKDIMDIPLPDKDFPLRAEKKGKGLLVICQANPFYYKDSQMNQRRKRSRAKMTRIVSTVLSNLGAPFKRTSMSRMLETGGAKDINLEGKWDFKIDPDDKGLKLGWSQKAWRSPDRQIEVPGTWEAQGVNTPNPKVDGKLPYDGFAWFQKQVTIPLSLKNKQLYLEIGTADDFDWSYFNGNEIGKTGKEHPKYYDTRRYYPIPAGIIKYGEKNLIALRIFDNYLSGGIPKGPVRITFKKDKRIPYLDADKDKHSRFDPYHFHRW